MRIGGLASGMDTDSMVKELMKAESIKVDRVKADHQVLEWKKESLNSLNKDFANFILDSKKDMGYNSLGRPGSQDWIKTAVSSDEKIGTATAGKSALGGKHNVEVTKLATGVSGVSNVKRDADKVTNAQWKTDRGSDIKDFKFMINGKEVSVGAEDSISQIAKKINASGAGVQASFDEKLGRFFIRTEKEGSEAKIEFKAIALKEGVDQTKVEESITGLTTFLNTIKVSFGSSESETDKLELNKEFEGEDGLVNYNGAKDLRITSNQFEFNGVKFDAKTVGKFEINVSNNADEIVNKVTKFVDEYNKMIETASNLVKEKQNRNYRPLTEDQKEAMSDKEVELWEKKAKSGLIKDDMDVEKMLSSLRSDLYKNIEGAGTFNHITQLGITTQGYKAGSAGGMLQIDEEKLRKAIEQDADSVMNILFKEDPKRMYADDKELSTKPEYEMIIKGKDEDKTINGLEAKKINSGLVTRIFDNIAEGMKGIIAKSGPGTDSDLFRKVKTTMLTDFVKRGGRYSGKGSISDLEDDMSKFTKRIEKLNIDLLKKENMYYARFTAMEKAMQKASSQSGWLMNQMQ